MSIEIREVTTKDELKQFVKYPFELYSGVEQWIPPIIQSEIDIFSKEKNTVFTHSEAIIYTAWKNDKMVGRIVGLINQMEVDFLQEKHARFGWIDFLKDPNWKSPETESELSSAWEFRSIDLGLVQRYLPIPKGSHRSRIQIEPDLLLELPSQVYRPIAA